MGIKNNDFNQFQFLNPLLFTELEKLKFGKREFQNCPGKKHVSLKRVETEKMTNL